MFSSTSWVVPTVFLTVLCFQQHRGLFLHIEYAWRAESLGLSSSARQHRYHLVFLANSDVGPNRVRPQTSIAGFCLQPARCLRFGTSCGIPSQRLWQQALRQGNTESRKTTGGVLGKATSLRDPRSRPCVSLGPPSPAAIPRQLSAIGLNRTQALPPRADDTAGGFLFAIRLRAYIIIKVESITK